ncbi:MAG: D-glycero-beta-D-manno-heptose 1,7-bisphosphate 7-phosphatase [Gammaproteobacteria bacterium]|jgi:D-glycero-D-manno-heptose 1,7-bisphosphate phosphatase
MSTKLIILDRDGVINRDSDNYIKSPEEFIPIAGSLEAIARLTQAGYTVVVATNQSGIARGYFNTATLDAMHDKLRRLLGDHQGRIDGIYYCPHGPDDECDCRKPQPGLLRQIVKDYQVPAGEVGEVVAIGDSLRDLQAAQQLGIRSVLVRTGKGKTSEASLDKEKSLAGTPVYDDLAAAVDALLGQHSD